MYLSRLILNPGSRQVQRELADPYEMHRTIMAAFSEMPKEEIQRVLFRLEAMPGSELPMLLVQSLAKPDWGHLRESGKNYLIAGDKIPLPGDNPEIKEFHLSLKPGQRLAFRMKANPTVKKDREGQRQGRRVGIIREEQQLAWLERKLHAIGCRLLDAAVSRETRVSGKLLREGERHPLQYLSVQFDGLLEVDDAAKAEAGVENGIGSAKGLGFGLLSLAPAGKGCHG